MSDHCLNCSGLIMEPNKAYGYAGKVCHCLPHPSSRYQRPASKESPDAFGLFHDKVEEVNPSKTPARSVKAQRPTPTKPESSAQFPPRVWVDSASLINEQSALAKMWRNIDDDEYLSLAEHTALLEAERAKTLKLSEEMNKAHELAKRLLGPHTAEWRDALNLALVELTRQALAGLEGG